MAVIGERDGDHSGLSEEVGEEGGVAKGVASGVTEEEAEVDEAEVPETPTEMNAVDGMTGSTPNLMLEKTFKEASAVLALLPKSTFCTPL